MLPRNLFSVTVLAALLAAPLAADPVALTEIRDWKPVYGRIEARDTLPARARIGGTLIALSVTEGDSVQAGQELGRIVDDKLAIQLSAVDAQIAALTASLTNAETELKRGEDLLQRGVTTTQNVDSLRTQAEVARGQIAAQQAQRRVLEQQTAEGAILAPIAGRVIDVPQAMGGVVMPGETVASIGGGGFFLRLAVPERHATQMAQGDAIAIDMPQGTISGKLERIYPNIENGRVVADVAVPGLPDGFVNARVLVRLPVSTRSALLVPATAITSRAGLDYVTVTTAEGPQPRLVVPGGRHLVGGAELVEILSGLIPGDDVQAVK